MNHRATEPRAQARGRASCLVRRERGSGCGLRACATILAFASALAAAPTIQLIDGAFVVRGSSGGNLAVYVDGAGEVPPLSGSISVEGERVTFRPKYPLQAGLRYRAVYGETEVFLSIEPDAPAGRAHVERIYPSTDRIPENQLKFYFHFSAPMSRGDAYRRISLFDETGIKIKLPFLELDQELWDQDNRRLTVFLDPGRIKRGLVPNMEEGPPLRSGYEFSLVVDSNWSDAAGHPLETGAVKRFMVIDADYKSPSVDAWKLTPARAGSVKPLYVEFAEPLDRALLDRLIQVVTLSRKLLPGRIKVDRDETRWAFTPDRAWAAGEYLLQVESMIEDLAGNSPGRPFEVDPLRQQSRPETAEVLYRKFVVK